MLIRSEIVQKVFFVFGVWCVTPQLKAISKEFFLKGITKKIKVFDFTLGDENYKKSWSNKSNLLYNYAYLNTLKGFYLFPLIKFKLFVKSLNKNNYLRKLILKIKDFFDL